MKENRHNEKERRILDSISDSFIQELRHLVRSERDETMMTMPADRVMRALRRTASSRSEEAWIGELVSWFRPVFVAGVLLVMAMAFYNVRLLSTDNLSQQTAAEMVFGLPPVTVASAYDIGLEDHP